MTCWANCFSDSSPIQYGLWAYIDNADDDALTYLDRVLPCLTPCGLTYLDIQVKNHWIASIEKWHAVDDALIYSIPGEAGISVNVNEDVHIPSWELLPYVCTDELHEHLLPKCAAKGLVCRCNDKYCRLHDPKRWSIRTSGTMQHLLDVLPYWTCPVRHWRINLESTFKESSFTISTNCLIHTTSILRSITIFTISPVLPSKGHNPFFAHGLPNCQLLWRRLRLPREQSSPERHSAEF